MPVNRVNCPCCGFLQLAERGEYEICSICNWEDDGQDDPYADEVWGGPNEDYSLTEARENFIKNLSMYREQSMSTYLFEQDSPESKLLWEKIVFHEKKLEIMCEVRSTANLFF